MKIVIDIYEKAYDRIIKHYNTFPHDISSYERDIVNGTPIKTGHWIDDNENEIDAQYGKHIYRCSECNKYANDFVGGIEDWWDLEKPNYCPNCGAKMEKED